MSTTGNEFQAAVVAAMQHVERLGLSVMPVITEPKRAEAALIFVLWGIMQSWALTEDDVDLGRLTPGAADEVAIYMRGEILSSAAGTYPNIIRYLSGTPDA